jgi:hypothetical protein
VPRAHTLAVQLEADVTLAKHGLVERTDDADSSFFEMPQ